MASLLLRLFHSDYFSPHLALSYLRTYSDNIGITYYLVYRLRTSFPPEEVEFYWPQLCHLLITKPSDSRALECFILERCEESVHIALLTLWHLQAALYDLSNNPHSASFEVCKRVYNECQRMLYDDPLQDANIYLSKSSKTRRRIFSSARAREPVMPYNVKSTFVGMGTVLASVPGMPMLSSFSGRVAVEQGRAKLLSTPKVSISSKKADDESSDEDQSSHHAESEGDFSDEEQDTVEPIEGSDIKKQNLSQEQSNVHSSTDLNTSKSPLSVNSDTLPPNNGSILKGSDQTFASISSGFNDFRGKAAAAVGDAFGQTFGVTFPQSKPSVGHAPNGKPAWHASHQRRKREEIAAARRSSQPAAQARSSPSLNLSRSSLHGPVSTVTLSDGTALPIEAVLSQYDLEARRRLLRSNYCRTQTEFLLGLQDISARLLLLPKPARLSALRAELTAMNHKLPADVCFPLWCPANAEEGGQDSANALEKSHSVPGTRSETSTPASILEKRHELRHHRVVRINPSESVVLNSADRAPYLLHVEVLQNDLDFDPDRRSNRESLKRLVVAEDSRRRKFALSRAFSGQSESASREALNKSENAREGTSPEVGMSRPQTPRIHLSHSASDVNTSRSAETPEVEPAIDMAADPSQHLRAVSPAADESEEIDLTEQAFGSDLGAFGSEQPAEDEEEEDIVTMNRNHDTAAWSLATNGGSQQHTRRSSVSGPSSNKRRDFSLDEYAERMRTAAIMLAQLNSSTNASSGPVVTHTPNVSATAQGGWSSWIVGTSWAPGSAPAPKSEIGQGSVGVKAPITTAPPPSSAIPHIAASTEDAQLRRHQNTVGPIKAGPSRLIHTDTEAIRKRIMQEMMLLEEERMERMKIAGQRVGASQRRPAPGIEDEATVMRAVNKDDPSAAMFKETWAAKKARIRASSPYGHLPSWDVFSVIVKIGADLRQEQLAVQLVNEFGRIWQDCKSRLWVRYFRILVTSESSGLMETITDAVSVHSIKKEAYAKAQKEQEGAGGKIATYSLFDHFINTYGDPSSARFGRARDRFMESLAAYSIISYLLQIKDRHNGNILVSSEGRIIHIDFGFMLGISPGGVGFEAAPFKLTQDYIDILGGLGSTKFEEFKDLMRQGFKDVRKNAERIIMIVELMQRDSKLPCFALGELTASNLRDRFALALSATQVDEFVDRLVLASCASSYTRLYDSFQYYSQGIL